MMAYYLSCVHVNGTSVFRQSNVWSCGAIG